MDKRPLRELWRQSKAALNGWVAIPDGFAAEAPARQGWDSVTVDMQHGLVAGIHCLSPDYAKEMVERNFGLATVGSDARFLMAGAGAAVSAARGTKRLQR